MTNLDRRVLLGVAGIAGIAAIHKVTQAGSLNPPAGPVTPTMKTLDQVEARTPVQSLTGDNSSTYVISQSGSYYLTGNVIGVSGRNGIAVAAPNVSIDLNGFSLLGVSGSLSGIVATNTANGLIVRNGNIASWGAIGVDAAANTYQARVEGVTVGSCASGGLTIGQRGFVTGCAVDSCGGFGIQTLSSCRVVQCVVTGTLGSGHGIACDYGSVIQDCTCNENGGSGFVTNGYGVLIVGCKAQFNILDGVTINSPGTEVIDTLATHNTQNGIHSTASNGRIDHCSANYNYQIGILIDTVGGTNVVTRCSSTSNFAAVANPDYSIASGNRPAQLISWGGPATGFASGDPFANTR